MTLSRLYKQRFLTSCRSASVSIFWQPGAPVFFLWNPGAPVAHPTFFMLTCLLIACQWCLLVLVLTSGTWSSEMPSNNQKNFLKQSFPPMDVSNHQTLWKDYSYWKYSMKSNGIKEKRCMLMYSFPNCCIEDGNIWWFVFPFAFLYFAPDVFSQIEQNMSLAKFLMFSCTAVDASTKL